MQMLSKSEKAKVLCGRLKRAREALDPKISQSKMAAMLSEESGEVVQFETYKKYENRTPISPRLAYPAARILGVDPDYLLNPEQPEVDFSQKEHRVAAKRRGIRTVIVRGAVQAGLFKEANQLPPDQWKEAYMPGDHPYAEKPLEGFRVVGDSMDELYPHDTWLIVCPTIYLGSGWMPEAGMHVIVHRINEWGEIEATVKEVHFDKGDLLLVPRSRNPAFQKPWRLKAEPSDAESDQERIRIAGLVVYSGRSAPGI